MEGHGSDVSEEAGDARRGTRESQDGSNPDEEEDSGEQELEGACGSQFE